MPPPFLVSIDLKHAQSTLDQGLDLKTISYLDNVFVTVTPDTLEDTRIFLQQNFGRFTVYLDVTSLESINDIVSLLNIGAGKVFVRFYMLKELVEERCIDLERLVVTLDHSACEGDPKEKAKEIELDLRTVVGEKDVGIHLHEVHDWRLLDALHERHGLKGWPLRYASLAHPTIDTYCRTAGKGTIPIIPAKDLTTDMTKQAHLIPAALLLWTSLQTERPDKLVTTIVSDQRGQSLGLAYSSFESIVMTLKTGESHYYSRSRKELWRKGLTSGNTQELVSIGVDCDMDCLQYVVRQKGPGFCHFDTATCFGPYSGLSKLEKTLLQRKREKTEGSYTTRLFESPKLLEAKIMEEADELCKAQTKDEVAFETADLLYFTLARCVAAGVRLEDVETKLDLKSMKVNRRKGDAKKEWAEKVGLKNQSNGVSKEEGKEMVKEAAAVPKSGDGNSGIVNGKIRMKRYNAKEETPEALEKALQRPSNRTTEKIMGIVGPIIDDVRKEGDQAVLKYTRKFEKAESLTSTVIHAPFSERLMQLPPETIKAIDVSFENIRKFHEAQKDKKPLEVETMPGVVCSRFSRPIERVGLYVPGGTAVLPSTALMLGVPAMVAGCRKIVMASPPRQDGAITPEIVYVAHKVGAGSIVLAGGAQAVAAMAYGTRTISKVDKILGPGNQFVTAAKMIVSNDTAASVSIDMPAGPSEVLVIADKTANPASVASDLLSQAEHGPDSQVVLLAVDLNDKQLAAIEDELDAQANALPRKDIVRGAIEHSVTIVVKDIHVAMFWSNQYAPEHLILQIDNAEAVVPMVQNAGSVFIGHWTPESVGDYSAGVNHSLPTYGYARQYSGVNLGSFTKHITSSNLTKQGLRNVGPTVMTMARVEALEAHRRAVGIRLESMAGEEA
ncbi:MAG: trifunctional histidinol dehydrogenase [Pleopsidium flavum]|nr:MAG: trifunctional histidinol dehydrogenase [Pleopsidium flavum]